MRASAMMPEEQAALFYRLAYQTSGGLIWTRGTAVNVIHFSSGYGDGSYPVFVGDDDQGNVCAVLTVFDVFDAEASSKQV
jgi:hypothetical protein